jgi:hypothetical protein
MPPKVISLSSLPKPFLDYADSCGFQVPRKDGSLSTMIPIDTSSTLTGEVPGCVYLSKNEIFVPMWSEDQTIQKNVRLGTKFMEANEDLKDIIRNTSLNDQEDSEWIKAWSDFAGKTETTTPTDSVVSTSEKDETPEQLKTPTETVVSSEKDETPEQLKTPTEKDEEKGWW